MEALSSPANFYSKIWLDKHVKTAPALPYLVSLDLYLVTKALKQR
jgi:hypothetical protein